MNCYHIVGKRNLKKQINNSWLLKIFEYNLTIRKSYQNTRNKCDDKVEYYKTRLQRERLSWELSLMFYKKCALEQ